MIKIVNTATGNVIAAYHKRSIPVFETYYPTRAHLSAEATAELRERFDRERVQAAIKHNDLVEKTVDSVLSQCDGLTAINTGDLDCYCPPEEIIVSNS